MHGMLAGIAKTKRRVDKALRFVILWLCFPHIRADSFDSCSFLTQDCTRKGSVPS